MKRIYNKALFIGTCLYGLLLTSCDYANGEGEGSENAVYMETPNNRGSIAFVLEEEGGSISIVPRLANITNEDVNIQVEHDNSILDVYNRVNSTSYEALPSTAFQLFSGEQQSTEGKIVAKVKKGDFSAKVNIVVGELDAKDFPNSTKYAIPLNIISSSAHQLIPSQRSVILVLNRPLITSVASLSGDGIRVKPSRVWEKHEWSLQMSGYFSSLGRSNLTTLFISGPGGSEFYTRIDGNKGIQIKNGSDGDETYTQKSLPAKKWLHLAYVFKDQVVTVYVNGKVEKMFKTSDIWFIDKTWVQIGNGGYSNDYVREVRVWSKALTEAEINDMLYTPISPKTPGLEVYLPLTEEVGVKDLVAPAETNNIVILPKARVTWLKNVKFPADDLIIVEKKTN